MPETLTLDTLLNAEKAATLAASSAEEPFIFKLITKDMAEAVTKLLNGVAEDPNKYAPLAEKVFGQKQAQKIVPPKTVRDAQFRPAEQFNQTPPQQAHRPTKAEAEEFFQEQPENSAQNFDEEEKFNIVYESLITGLNQFIENAGDMKLSQVVKLMESNPELCKQVLKPVINNIRSC
ncbi:hypothetical protein [Methanolapillus millepedarum]|uniref:Uncharacterized protein n=1 Tax=Methanolapillus millepedarum TaxID=3028296 RepID=A0AA96ZVF7_9EURY|nr:hypothetical protein MsAc7_03270 [Methanosarcinaceae archaeon Ac7]